MFNSVVTLTIGVLIVCTKYMYGVCGFCLLILCCCSGWENSFVSWWMMKKNTWISTSNGTSCQAIGWHRGTEVRPLFTLNDNSSTFSTNCLTHENSTDLWQKKKKKPFCYCYALRTHQIRLDLLFFTFPRLCACIVLRMIICHYGLAMEVVNLSRSIYYNIEPTAFLLNMPKNATL